MGKRSEFPRRVQDTYQTIDARAVGALLPHLINVRSFAEPCCGDGFLTEELERQGLTCAWSSDIEGGFDAFHLYSSLIAKADAIITNPPWTRQLLHPLIAHFMYLKPTWLLFDADWAFNRHARLYLPNCTHIVAVGRLKWIENTTMVGKDNAAWYRFDGDHKTGPHFYGRT